MTPEYEATLRELSKQGLSSPKIAEAVGRHASTVRLDLIKLGLFRPKKMASREQLVRMHLDQGRTIAEIARFFQVDSNDVGAWMSYHGIEVQTHQTRRYSVHDIARLRELYLTDGLSIPQVAYRFRCSEDKIRELMRANDIPARKGKDRPRRRMVRVEDVPYAETMTGEPLMNTFAILECGHRVKLWRKNLIYKHELRDYYGCDPCAREERKDSGRATDGTSQRADDVGGSDEGAGEGDRPVAESGTA